MRQSPVKCTLQSAGRSLNVYAVYKMRVISQNSRRKVIAEGQTVSWNSPPSPLYFFRDSGSYERKGKPSIGTESLMHPSPVQMYLRATVQDGVSGLVKQSQIFYCLCTNMAALSFFLISKKWLRVYLHVRLFGTV
jgi:hypothetical protein